jgi:type IV secretory pathway protease TraF
LDEPYLPPANYTYSRQFQSQLIQVAEGSYFLLGDNRLWSYDSRAYGDVHRSLLVGLISN